VYARQAIVFARAARSVRPALVNGEAGLVLAPRGRLLRALSFSFAGDRITGIEVIVDPARLRGLELAVLE
jgi:RNA polymerase sigma-70 factor (ECF subfamily)